MKTKMLMPVLAILLVFGVANTAFAQLSCSVASTPVSRDTDTGHTEVVGDLIFNCTGGPTATTQATMTIDYGVVITNSTTYPLPPTVPVPGKPIAIISNTGGFAGAGSPFISTVSNTTGQIVITVPAQAAPVAGSFVLTGVLASLAGSGKTTLNANVSVSPGNNVLITAGQNNATVITSILPGLKNPVLTTTTFPQSSGLILSSGNIVTPGFSISIGENYIDMFRSAAQFNSGFSTNSVRILLTFAGIPTGVTLSGCSVNVTAPGTVYPAGTAALVSGSSLTSTSNTLTVEFPLDLNLTALDTVNFGCTTTTLGSTAVIPLTPGNITVTATLAPTGAALSSTNTVLTSATAGQIPRYANTPLPVPPLPVITIVPASTNLLIPYAVAEGAYDTGIAIANTTTDPYGTAAGAGGARPQGGTITFSFYPRTGSSCTVTPSTASVGVGLSSGGILDTGRTYTVLLSELLRSGTGCPTAFTGYVFAVANFTNAHGSAFVSDFRNFTSYTNVLVLVPPTLASRSVTFAEILGH